MATQHVITTFTHDPALRQGTDVNPNKLLHYQYLKNKIKVLSDIQEAGVGMCECIVALLITLFGANEFCFLYVALWLYKEAELMPCMTVDETPISLLLLLSTIPSSNDLSHLASSYLHV